MNKKIIIGTLTLVVVIGVTLVWWRSTQTDLDTSSANPSSSKLVEGSASNSAEAESKQSSSANTPSSVSSTSDSTSNTTPDVTTSVKPTTITYSSGSFSPTSTSISVGDSVQFVNADASVSVNIASGQHPTHTVFSPLNLGLLPPGKTSSAVKFDQAGVFTFHNHTNASQAGTITVK